MKKVVKRKTAKKKKVAKKKVVKKMPDCKRPLCIKRKAALNRMLDHYHSTEASVIYDFFEGLGRMRKKGEI